MKGTTRLKYLCEDVGQYGLNVPAPDYVGAEDGLRLIRTTDLREDGLLPEKQGIFAPLPVDDQYRLREGDVLVSRSGTIGRSFLVPAAAVGLTFAGFLVRFRPHAEADPRFLNYALQSQVTQHQIQSEAISSTIQNFNGERYANLALPDAPLEEQRRIADFLDDQVALLDRAIGLRQQQIDLAHERLDNVISGSMAKQEDAGVVPTRLKYLAEVPITNGLGEAGKHADPSWPRYVRTMDIAGPRNLRDDVFASLPPEIAQKALLKRGDFLMTAAGATIGKSVLFDEQYPACFAGFLVRFRATNAVSSDYLSFWMRSTAYWDQVKAKAVRSTIENFSASKYQNLEIDLPSRQVQDEIAQALTQESAYHDRLVRLFTSHMSLFRERKQALITTAVTGEFDVTTARRVSLDV